MAKKIKTVVKLQIAAGKANPAPSYKPHWSETAFIIYTSGTTGDPKGVLYSHRSNVLHSLIANNGDALGATSKDTMLPVVPLFHANSWGIVFSAPAMGTKLVMPGPKLDGESVYELVLRKGVLTQEQLDELLLPENMMQPRFVQG